MGASWRGGARHPRRRRRIDAARGGGGERGGGAARGSSRWSPASPAPATTVSVDTSKAAVAEAALDAGATIVNDVTALRGDPEMAALCAERGAGVVLMHMQGDPRTMQDDPTYDDVVDDVKAFLAERLEAAVAAGVAEERIWLDPGIGFGKTARAQPGAAAPARRAARPRPAAGRSAPRARASSARSTAPRPASGSAARSPPRSSPPPRAPTCCASTTSPRSRQAARVAARSSGRLPADGGTARQRDRVERRGRAARALDLHPPRRHRRRAGGRAAARVRHLLRRPRLRRGAHRPARGHRRLRRGLRHRRPRRDRAQLQDPGAPRPGRRRAADGALRLRIGPRPRRQARAAAAAGDPGGRGRGHPGARRTKRTRRDGEEASRWPRSGPATSASAPTSATAPAHLRAAVELLRERGVEVEAVSSTYETEPVGEVLDQPDFLNAAVRIRTELEPEALLDALQGGRGRARPRLRRPPPQPAPARRRPAPARRPRARGPSASPCRTAR